MIRLPQRETKSLLAIHGWSAVFLGLLLYVVIVTGVASVFADEIGDWASPLPTATTQRFPAGLDQPLQQRSEEHTSELQSLMRISYAVFCLKKKQHHNKL